MKEFVKAFGKKIGWRCKLPGFLFRWLLRGHIHTKGTPALHRYKIPAVFMNKVKEQMDAEAHLSTII